MQKLLNPKEMGEELVRAVIDPTLDPTDRIKVADGYASHVEAYAEAAADTKTLAALETFLNILEDEPVETAVEVLREKIKEMKAAKASYEVAV